MGRGRLSVVAVGLMLAAVLLAVAGAGEAKLRRAGKLEVQPADTAGLLSLGKEKGYRTFLYMPGKRIVVFYAIGIQRLKGDSFGLMYSIYATRNRGNLDHGVVRARFGSLGRASLRFRPNGRIREDDSQGVCGGEDDTVEYGSFAGHLSFRGEGNYFHVTSPRGKAYLSRSPRLRCKKGQAAEPQPRSLRKYVASTPLFHDDDSIALLYASTRSHGRYVGITAMHAEGSPPGAEVELGVVDSRRGLAIGHGAYLEGFAGTLRTSLPGAHPATATLAPPAPFYGEATYSEEAGDWTGTLGVKLAGLKLPLTGPGYRVHLCVVNPLKDKDRCEFFKTEPPYFERPARLGRGLG